MPSPLHHVTMPLGRSARPSSTSEHQRRHHRHKASLHRPQPRHLSTNKKNRGWRSVGKVVIQPLHQGVFLMRIVGVTSKNIWKHHYKKMGTLINPILSTSEKTLKKQKHPESPAVLQRCLILFDPLPVASGATWTWVPFPESFWSGVILSGL